MPRNTLLMMIKRTTDQKAEETDGGDKETARCVRTEWVKKLDDDDDDDDDDSDDYDDDESLELQVTGFDWASKVMLG
jgi:hypothetical protein